MRGDDGDDTAGGEDEIPSVRLADGVARFILNQGWISVHERVLRQATADDTFKILPRFGETRRSLSVMPVNNGEEQ